LGTVSWSSGNASVVTVSGPTVTGLAAGSAAVTATLNGVTGSTTITVADSHVIKHIILMAQENRSFDHYFGMLNAYRIAQGLPADVDDLAAATGGAASGTITPDCIHWIACNPAFTTSAPLPSFHYTTVSMNDLSPSWNETHVDFDREADLSLTPKNDGFAWTAGGYVQSQGLDGGTWDIQGIRAMGYFTDRELPYYYFMATQFATSDRFFAPAPTRTQPNRLYIYAATSHGHIYEPTASDGGQLAVPTIFDLLQNAGISWKIYYSDLANGSPDTYFYNFSSSSKLASGHLFPITQYYTDLQNGTLPAVALIEGGYEFGLDEHPNNNVQNGARYVSKLINALMNSTSWNNSVFFLTYDEGGAMYDHVAPMMDGVNGAQVPNPDGILPSDYLAGDLCTTPPDPTNPACNFLRTGFRLPILVVSPFTKPHYVSHTPMDTTAILKFIETRFGLPNLTKRDAVQAPMDEFFDYAGVPNATPPPPPDQPGQDCDGLTQTCTGPTMPVAPQYQDHVP
jgi:phospholipase C